MSTINCDDIDFFLTCPDGTYLAGTWHTLENGAVAITCYDCDQPTPALLFPGSVPSIEVMETLRERMAERARSARNSANASTASTS